MPEPLTIYECTCGHVEDQPRYPHVSPHSTNLCHEQMLPVRVFREEDVRPLWEAAVTAEQEAILAREAGEPSPTPSATDVAWRAFPAPPEWTGSGSPDHHVDEFVGIRAGRSGGWVFWRAVCEPCGFVSSPVVDKAAAIWKLRQHGLNCDVAAQGEQAAFGPTNGPMGPNGPTSDRDGAA